MPPGLVTEIRISWRLLWRTPALSLGAALALALAVGPTTVFFAIIYTVLFRPLPYRDSHRLIVVSAVRQPRTPTSGVTAEPYPMNGSDVRTVETLTNAFESIAVVQLSGQSSRDPLVAGDKSLSLRGGLASVNLFHVLGVEASLGRTFVATDAHQDVVLLTDHLWRTAFGSDEGIVGRTVRVDGVIRTVIGVLPRALQFTYPNATEFWLPFPTEHIETTSVMNPTFRTIARLRDDVSVDQATEALRRVVPFRLAGSSMLVAQPLSDWVSGRVRPAMQLLSITGVLLLVTAYANCALLLVVRAIRYAPENAVRAALGASRSRLLRQAMIECGTVAIPGAGIGIVLALLMTYFARSIVPAVVPRMNEMTIDYGPLVYAALAGLLGTFFAGATAYLLGIHTRASVQNLSHAGQRATLNKVAKRSRTLLVGGQSVGLVVILVVTTVLLHSFWRLWQVDLGFQSKHLKVFQITPWTPPRQESVLNFRRELSEKIRAAIRTMPGVNDVVLTNTLPFTFRDGGDGFNRIRQSQGNVADVNATSRSVTAGYFRLLGIKLLAGRDFVDSDARPDVPLVTVVSRSLAAALYPSTSAVGRTLIHNGTYEIVGIVDDVRWRRPDEAPIPTFYRLWDQAPGGGFQGYIVDSVENLPSLDAAIRMTLRTIDPNQAVDFVTTMQARVNDQLSEHRFFASSTIVIGLLALVLAAIGVFASVAASVSERVREIAIRAALGAQPRTLLVSIMLDGLMPVVIGVAGGSLLAVFSVRIVRNLLFEVSVADPIAFVGAPMLILLVSTMAVWIPARQVINVNLTSALRNY